MDITSSQLVTPQCLLSQGLYNQLLVCFSWHGALLEFFRESFCPVTLWKVWSKLKEDRYKYFSGVPTELKKTRDDFGVIIFGKVSWGFMSKSWQLHDVQLWVVWAFCFCFFFFPLVFSFYFIENRTVTNQVLWKVFRYSATFFMYFISKW